MNIDKIRQKVLPILKQHNVKKAGLFGSAVRGEMKKGSDIDIVVEIKDNISLLDFIGIKMEMEHALGKSVDLVEYSALKPALRKSILGEEVSII